MNRLLLLLVLLCSHMDGLAKPFETTALVGELELQRCSTSTVTAMVFFNVGKAALYLQDCNQRDNKLQQPIQLSIIYSREFSAVDFAVSATELLRKNLGKAAFERIEDDLAQFNQYYQPMTEGDRYDICFSPATGLILMKNGEEIGRSRSVPLGNAYFKIWFGDKPFSKKLKKQLLAL